MVTEIVYSVIKDTSNRRVTVTSEEDVKTAAKKSAAGKDATVKSAAAKTQRKKATPKVEKKAVETEKRAMILSARFALYAVRVPS